MITEARKPPPFHPVMFDVLTGSMIWYGALQTFGAPGPSGVDAKSCVVFVLHFMLLLMICVKLWHFLLSICVPPISHCACAAAFSVDHALSCPKGGLPSLHHNKIKSLTAHLLTEVCHQVQVEPELHPVSNPDTFSHATANCQEFAQLDIVMNRFWGGHSKRCFMDVRIFTQSNVHSISAAYRHHENITRRTYGQRVQEIEHA